MAFDPPNAKTDQCRFVDLVISSTNTQHGDLIGDIQLVALLFVNGELIEAVECPKSTMEGEWRPEFMTDLYVFLPQVHPMGRD